MDEVVSITLGLILLGLWIWLAGWMLIEKTLDGYGPERVLWGIGTALVIAVPIALVIHALNVEDKKPFDGYLYRKTHTPSTTTYVLSGKVMIPITYPERWTFILKNSTGEARACDVSEAQFETSDLGTMQHCGGY